MSTQALAVLEPPGSGILPTSLAIPVIKRVHGNQVEEAIRGAAKRAGSKRAPLDQLRVFHTAEEELLTVSPLIRENDRTGKTETDGYHSELPHYQIAFVDLVLEYKRRVLVPQAINGVNGDRLREIRCEVVTQYVTIIETICTRHYRPASLVRELNSLELSATGCLLSVYNQLEERILNISRQIDRLNERKAEILGQYKRRVFGLMRPRPRTRQHHDELKSITTALNRLREEKADLLYKRNRQKLELAATMEVIMDFIAGKKKRVLSMMPSPEYGDSNN